MLTAGTVVAEHLRLVRQLGSGGMGSVWIAEQTRLGQNVAVKFLSTALLDHESARSRFDREARLAAKIKSPHVVQIHDHGLTRGEPAIPYIVMELLDGQDLSKVLDAEGPLRLDRANEVLSQVCDALTKAHEAGIVHRDIKPENVFVLNEGRTFVKLLDFGVAHGNDGQIDRLTQTGLLLGTAHYMSPEQLFSGKDIDTRADLWALAVLTYQMLSNELPFQAETFGQLCLRVRDGGFEPISSRVSVPPGMDQWFTRGLCTDRMARFQSAAEMAQSFRKVLAGEWLGDPAAAHAGTETKNKPRENTGTVRVDRSVISKAQAESLAQADGGRAGVPKTERWGSQPGTNGSGSSPDPLGRGTLPSGEHSPFVVPNTGDWAPGPNDVGSGVGANASGPRASNTNGSGARGVGGDTPLSALEGSFGTEARGALAFNADVAGNKPRSRGMQLIALAAGAIVLGLGAVLVWRSGVEPAATADLASQPAVTSALTTNAPVDNRPKAGAAEVVVMPTASAELTADGEKIDSEGGAEIGSTPSVEPSLGAGNTVVPEGVRPHTTKTGATPRANANGGRPSSKANADGASEQSTGEGSKGSKPAAPEKKKYRGF